MNIELENNSAPLLEKFFKDRPDIEGVIVDLDNTLFLTDEYFEEAIFCIGMDIAEHLDIYKPSELIAQELNNKVGEIYKRNKYHPRLINEECAEALMEYLNIEKIPENMQNILDYWLKDFYLKSPELNKNAVIVLNEVRECDKRIGSHSHAPNKWTAIKADVVSEELGEDFPYFATDINMKKDMYQWLEACKSFGFSIENTMVIGDSFSSDIIPSIQAGCKHVIWIDRYNKGLDKDYVIPGGVEVIVVNNIGQIVEL